MVKCIQYGRLIFWKGLLVVFFLNFIQECELGRMRNCFHKSRYSSSYTRGCIICRRILRQIRRHNILAEASKHPGLANEIYMIGNVQQQWPSGWKRWELAMLEMLSLVFVGSRLDFTNCSTSRVTRPLQSAVNIFAKSRPRIFELKTRGPRLENLDLY